MFLENVGRRSTYDFHQQMQFICEFYREVTD